ncbi:HepT-like ribonuclease domain-containing protein [Tepidimonas charontis]|uniref:HepT-like ribonuclease domain-containing protein n=1 Tax=Tepidimonas charontis TaxID=2267262 RepID=UPI002E26220B
MSSELVQDAVLRNFEIIGEAANKLQRADPVFAAQNAHIPWQALYTMRNRVSHGYDQVDLVIVWKTIQHDLPRLCQQIRAIPGTAPDIDPGSAM